MPSESLKFPIAVLASVLVVAFIPSKANAWGGDGHRVIAALADVHLTPTSKNEIARLLADEPDKTLVGISFWADEHKNRYTAPMHYVNMPIGQCHYEAERDCPDGRCVVGAILRFEATLADQTASSESRVTALKMLVHLVGDAHQPLHAGFEEDRGGNLFQLQWQGRGSNLHKLWDRQLLESIDPDWTSYAATHGQGLPPLSHSISPERWVEESCALVNKPGFYPPDRKVGNEYLGQWKPVLEAQLRLAGVRLADLLNSALVVK